MRSKRQGTETLETIETADIIFVDRHLFLPRMMRLRNAIADARRHPSSFPASLSRGLCPAGVLDSLQPLVREYGQTPAAVLQYRCLDSTFASEPESSSSRPFHALCCGWWDAPILQRVVPEQTQEVADKAAEAVRRRRLQLMQEVSHCDFTPKEQVKSLFAHLPGSLILRSDVWSLCPTNAGCAAECPAAQSF